MIEKIDAWHKTKAGYATFAVLELGLTYMFFAFSIDRGNPWDYIFTLLFAVGTLQNLVKFGKAVRAH
jgi:sulfite exporter TauE/SafE